LRRGEHFGEASALNDIENPFTVEAYTPKVELYKIHRSYFIQHFGGLTGEPVSQLRASIILRHNWLNMKFEYLKTFSVDQISNLEYRNEEEWAKLKQTKTNPKEIPFLKNNPREKELTGNG